VITPTIVDADGHVVESMDEMARCGWDRPTTGNVFLDMLLNREPFAMERAICDGARPFTAESRVADMDLERIGVSVNYPTALLLLNQIESVDVANELAHAYNSWAYETFTEATGGRVLTMALVNISDPAAATAEARRAVIELGAPGICVPPFMGARHLDDPSLDPLWAVAEELDVAIGVHGGRNTTDPVMPGAQIRDQKRYYALSHPIGQMVALGDVVIGGVLERFPRLRVAFLEAGCGWARWYVDRLDEAAEAVENFEPGAELALAPSEYALGGRCFFTCEPDEPGLTDVIRLLGEDLVLFASDYPHFDCAFPTSTDDLATHLVDGALLRKVTVDNPRRLYGNRLG